MTEEEEKEKIKDLMLIILNSAQSIRIIQSGWKRSERADSAWFSLNSAHEELWDLLKLREGR